MNQLQQLPDLHSVISTLEENVARVVLGKRDVTRMCLVALLSGEHVLLEDVPGVGKTLMGKALSKSVSGEFRRIQFTPDLLPSDIIGGSVYNSHSQEFVFHPGPIFGNFVLADEINRAPPRTQSALLEAMSDAQVTIDGTTHILPRPFMVIATQNPFEFEGTYVLPESQLDRFLLRVSMGYPDRDFEQDIISSHKKGEPVDELTSVIDTDSLGKLQESVRTLTVDPSITQYMLDVVHATRESAELAVGASTRGALLWHRAAQALAFVEGRDFVVPDDAKQLAISVLAHRVMVHGYSQGGQRSAVEGIVQRIVDQIPLP